MHVSAIKPLAKSLAVTADGKEYLAKKDSGITAGMNIEAQIETSEYNGKTYHWIKKWKASNGSAAPQASGAETVRREATPAVAAPSSIDDKNGPEQLSQWYDEAIGKGQSHKFALYYAVSMHAKTYQSASGAEVRAKLQEICDRWNWRGPARESNLDITIREARALLARTDSGGQDG